MNEAHILTSIADGSFGYKICRFMHYLPARFLHMFAFKISVDALSNE